MSRGLVVLAGWDKEAPGIRQLLEESGFEVASIESSSALDRAALSREPCAVLFLNKIEVDEIRAIRTRYGPIALIVVIHPDQAQAAIDSLKAGATDVWCRPINFDMLLPAILASAPVLQRDNDMPVMRDELERRFAKLSFREKQVMDMVVRGLMSRQIAQSLAISSKTVDVHRANILRKTGASNAVELARIHAAIKPGPSRKPPEETIVTAIKAPISDTLIAPTESLVEQPVIESNP